jgi:Predicted hydrolases or acyltransferases (alpha/beta hydrolase superfamily)
MPCHPCQLLGHDYHFKNSIEGFPDSIQAFENLIINSFTTSDSVRLTWWEAGEGSPLVFVPGWSSNGTDYFYIIWLLSKKYRVYVLDHRNQGLSAHSHYGSRVSRYAQDLNEFLIHIKAQNVYLCGHSMGASVLWSYIDSYGTTSIKKLVLVDQAPALFVRQNWTENERLRTGAFCRSAELMIDMFSGKASFNKMVVNTKLPELLSLMDSPFYENVREFGKAIISTELATMIAVMWDHIHQDWRDVISMKINVPTAIFTGENSDWLDSQKWIHSVLPGSVLHIYDKNAFGDHNLMMKNPQKFSDDLDRFLSTQ